MRLPGVSLGPDYYLTDAFRGRVEYPELRRKVVELAARHRSGTILIEEARPWPRPGSSLETRPIGIILNGSKADRMVAQTAKIEAGHVYLPKKAPWLAEFLSELLGFPNGRHDDQVDSVS